MIISPITGEKMAIYLEMKDKEREELLAWFWAHEVSMWRIHRELDIADQTVKGWKRGWWLPSQENVMKLYALKVKIEKELKRF